MHLQELEELIAKATPAPWAPDCGKVSGEPWMWAAFGPVTAGPTGVYFNQLDKDFKAQLANDALLIATFRNLAPELLALWKAANEARFLCCLDDGMDEPLDAINAKLEAIEA